MNHAFEPSPEELEQATREANVAFIDAALAQYMGQLNELQKTLPELQKKASEASTNLAIAKAQKQHINAQIGSLKSLKWGMR